MSTVSEEQSTIDPGETRLKTLAVLNACGYLDDEAAVRVLEAMRQMPEIDLRFDGPREMLDWLVREGFVDAQAAEEAAVRFVEKLETGEAPDGLIQYGSIVEKIDPRFKAPLAAFAERRRKKVKRIMVGYGLGIPAIIAAGAFYILSPPSTPSCTASHTTKALSWIGIKSNIERVTKSPGMYLNNGPDTTPQFEDFQEVGYDDGDRSRGCTAVVKVGELKTPIGYVIRPKDAKDEFEVHTYPKEYVTARYSATGLNKALGAPLGREAIRAAVMEGIQGTDGRVGARAPAYGKPLYGNDAPTTMEASVMGVLPAADCRKIDERSYACPVLIDYKDPLLSVIGALPYVQLKGEFVFERDANAWKVANGFDEKFLSTLVSARVRNTVGGEAADKVQQSLETKASAQ